MSLAVAAADRALLIAIYRAFNARDIAAVLAHLHPAVEWPNGMEGGHLRGHEAVRAYWQRQWAAIDPRVEPQEFRSEAPGRVAVEVRLEIRNRAGTLLRAQRVEHVYAIENGLVRRMDIVTR
jgi:nuclear transport factor 2 (NTF2) superfamily protein